MTVPLFDAHCDTLSVLIEKGGSLHRNGFHIDLERLSKYAPAAQMFAVWNGRYREKAALLKAELAEHEDTAVFCRSMPEVRAAAKAGKTAALLSVEGAEQLDCSVAELRRAKEEDGLIMIGLCWNHDNALCGAAMDSGSGLTEAGREFVCAAQETGVAVDLSHASEKTFWDVLEITARPVIASHSNSAGLRSVPRNLTDAQFKALAGCGGGAGLNLCRDFLGDAPDVETCAEHIAHFLSLGGEKSVFIGADLDGIDGLPDGMDSVEHLGKIYEALLRRNYGEDLVRNIFYYNLLNILERATT